MIIAIDIRKFQTAITSSEVVLANLIRALMAQDGENTYHLLIDPRPPAEIAAIAARLGITADTPRWRIVPLAPGNRFLWTLWSAQRYCRRQRVDILHTEYIVPFLVPRRTGVVTHVHDVSFAALPQYIGWKDLLWLRLLIPRSLARADAIVAVSTFTRDEILRYYAVDPDRVHITPNALAGVFADESGMPSDRIAAVRERYDLPERFILSLGTMQPRKNIPFLIRAFAAVADRMPDVHLVLSGARAHHFDRDIDDALAQTAALSARIRLIPPIADREDVPAVYAAAATYAFPSVYEGFGLPILEAMSRGVPTVTSDIPVFREVGGGAALYADSRDLAAFGDALYNATMDAAWRQEARERGFARVRMFSWHESAARLLTLYRRLRT